MLWRIYEFVRTIFSKKARGGMAPEEAVQSARRDLGGMEQVKENVRDIRSGAFLDTLAQDLNYALRTLTKNQAFAGVMLWDTHLSDGSLDGVAPANFYDWRQQSRSFDKMAAIDPYSDFILNGSGAAKRLVGCGSSSDWYWDKRRSWSASGLVLVS
jgi:hypothetical protein